MTARNDCTQILDVVSITHAFKNNLQGISNKIITCFYSCFQPLFTKWALIMYAHYPKDLITFISDTAFTDGILRLKETIHTKGLYQGNASIKTIVFSFYKNTFRETLQREKRRQDKQKDAGEADLATTPAPGEHPDYQAKENLHLSIEHALSQMDEQDRQIILWRHIDGKSNEEIAGLLGITKESATNRIYRCMERLRQLIENNKQK